jgi:hypothetical protein
MPDALRARTDAFIVRPSEMHTIVRRARRVAIGLALAAMCAGSGCTCSKESSDDGGDPKRTPAKVAPSTSTGSSNANAGTESATTAGATTAQPSVPRPRYLRKVRPDDVQASTSTDLARAAFDGDRRTAWIAGEPGGKGAWIEARWYSPHGVSSVVADTGNSSSIAIGGGDAFLAGAHAKSIHLQMGNDAFAGLDVPSGDRSVTFEALDRNTQRIRFVIDDTYAGTKSSQLAITEISILADASQFPSVPESIVASEVKGASSKRDVASILHRFGVNPAIDRGGEVSFMNASLVDRLGRERLLVVSVVGPPDANGMCDEDDHFVFLATTDDDRLISLGSDVVSAKTHEGAPIDVALRAFHSGDVDDVVATWSSCSAAVTKNCHGMRVWSMQRGFPERILDVAADDAPKLGDDGRGVAVGGAVYVFDPKSFTYH